MGQQQKSHHIEQVQTVSLNQVNMGSGQKK